MLFSFSDDDNQFGATLNELNPGQYTQDGTVYFHINDTKGLSDTASAYALALKASDLIDTILSIGYKAVSVINPDDLRGSIQKILDAQRSILIQMKLDMDTPYGEDRDLIAESVSRIEESIGLYSEYKKMGDDELTSNLKIVAVSAYEKGSKVIFSMDGAAESILVAEIDALSKSMIKDGFKELMPKKSNTEKTIH